MGKFGSQQQALGKFQLCIKLWHIFNNTYTDYFLPLPNLLDLQTKKKNDQSLKKKPLAIHFMHKMFLNI
jgi:hypothetical protein